MRLLSVEGRLNAEPYICWLKAAFRSPLECSSQAGSSSFHLESERNLCLCVFVTDFGVPNFRIIALLSSVISQLKFVIDKRRGEARRKKTMQNPYCTNLNVTRVHCGLPAVYLDVFYMWLCAVPFVLAHPWCDNAEAGVAEGLGEFTPAPSLSLTEKRGRLLALERRCSVRFGGSSESYDVPLPSWGGGGVLFKTLRAAIVLPFRCWEGEGCCLWNFSMALLNQADRF